MSELLLVERRERVALLTLNRPEKRNALSLDLRAELVERLALEAAAEGLRRGSAEAIAAITTRQREVAALIGEGCTNRQIAERLVLSEGTVANHVEHILTRLGFSNRAQIAAWITRHGQGHPEERPDPTSSE